MLVKAEFEYNLDFRSNLEFIGNMETKEQTKYYHEDVIREVYKMRLSTEQLAWSLSNLRHLKIVL